MTIEVAIIGAGLGGPGLALELLNVPGVTCTVYELRGEGYEEGQHISLAPNALRVMKNIGVFEKLEAIGNTYEKLYFRNAAGAVVAAFNVGDKERYGFGAMRIHRRFVQEVLVEECKAKGIKIQHNMKLLKVHEEESKGKVTMTFANGQTAHADFVAGVDGLHSAVRKHVVANSRSVYAGMMGVTAILRRDQVRAAAKKIELPSHFIGHTGFIAIMPSDVSGEELGVFSTMDFKEEKSREEWERLSEDKVAVRALLKERFSKEQGWCELVDLVCNVSPNDTMFVWPFYISPQLPQWSSKSGRVLVMGDAAHAMIPTGGLGASLAFEDAECFAHVLASLSGSKMEPQILQQALGIWEGHRKERLAMIQDFTNRNRKLRQAGGSWLAQYVKEWVIWLMFKISSAGGFMSNDGLAERIFTYDTEIFKRMLPKF
ncbi:FAD binding domain-containing protein [Cladophialophora immunda]|nr:FAD binding domain-containing protein [Cladophialophora immunda]